MERAKNEINGDHKTFNISIIEDSVIHAEWLKEKIAEDLRFRVISVDYSGRLGIKSVIEHKPSVVMLDFQLPDITGLEVAKRIKLHLPSTKIFSLTAHTEISIIERMIFNKNIDAIAIKGSSYFEENFLNALIKIIHGETYLDPSLLDKLRESKKYIDVKNLTNKEFEIFIQTSSGKSSAKIAEDLCVEISHVQNLKSIVNKKINRRYIGNLLSSIIENNNIK